MSYARFGGTGHYIWHDDTRNQFVFNLHKVDDDEMAVFLYKIMVLFRILVCFNFCSLLFKFQHYCTIFKEKR